MKIKTLKDLVIKEINVEGLNKNIEIPDVAYVEDLKAEAIKWVKHLKYEKYKKSTTWDVIPWIKEFFNIEEEDLK